MSNWEHRHGDSVGREQSSDLAMMTGDFFADDDPAESKMLAQPIRLDQWCSQDEEP